MKLSRDGLNRFQGSLNDYWLDEDTVWEDHKESELFFPIHNQYKASEVVIWNLNDK
jgi:hypothetical protein